MSIFIKDSFEDTELFKDINPVMLVGLIIVGCVLLFVLFQGLFSYLFSSNEFELDNNNTTISEKTSGSDSSFNSQDGHGIHVHILGSVVCPGMYELPEKSRVNDAVNAAGGLKEDAEERALNLARVLQDGEQIYVQSQQEYLSENNVNFTEDTNSNKNSSMPYGIAGQGSNSSSGLININNATLKELETLPGIGEATAKKIIDYRSSNGGFSTTKDITKVSGVGEKRFEQIKSMICV